MRSLFRLTMLSGAGGLAAMLAAAATNAAVTISSAPTSNMSCVSGVCTPTAVNAVLNVGDLTTMLASSNVTVNTGTGTLAQQVEDIIVTASFNWASANSLTLDAYRSVTVDQPIAVNGAAPLSLITNDGGSGGNLSFISGGSLSFLSPANSLSINGKPYRLTSSISALAAAIKHKASGSYALSASYDAKQDGAYAKAPISTTFEGTFNGLGNTISHLAVDATAAGRNVGLFGNVGASGTVNSLRITEANITAKQNSYVGVLVGINYGMLSNAFSEGSILTKSGKMQVEVGGLVGVNRGSLFESASTVNIRATGHSSVAQASVGGVVGDNQGMIESSYATGSSAVTNGVEVAAGGGLVGFNNGTINNCYATGPTNVGAMIAAGGLVGYNDVTVTNSYSTGAPSSDGASVGGSIGYDVTDGADLSDIYWDTTTSGITNLSQGAGNIANDPGITGETTAQLQSALPAGFDPTIWAENPSINDGLPYLIANPPQ